MRTVYNWAVNDFMDPAALANVDRILGLGVPLGSLSDLLVTLVYAHRIWKFGGTSLIVRGIVSAIVSGAWGPDDDGWSWYFVPHFCATLHLLTTWRTSIAISVMSFKPETYAEFSGRYMWLWDATLSARVAVDFLIASTTCTMLYRCRKHAKRTKSVIRLVILYTVNTCVLTTICSLMVIITYAAFPDTFIAFTFSFFIPHLMFNSLLAILNSRQMMRNAVARKNMQPISLSGATLTQQMAMHVDAPGDVEKAQEPAAEGRAADATECPYEVSMFSTIAGEV
ncbi:hypothetical protein PsYK624_101680 [Phanerochaete sordida]|uniref:DUF6534 domain-containing protein n=1 Tax=Phanerochaete sordida TaxID=48140 RepID=A0A9P3LG67_9APHY|nr:hypothetical protein PsYK624_101680 [Phanerochaete sordida]